MHDPLTGKVPSIGINFSQGRAATLSKSSVKLSAWKEPTQMSSLSAKRRLTEALASASLVPSKNTRPFSARTLFIPSLRSCWAVSPSRPNKHVAHRVNSSILSSDPLYKTDKCIITQFNSIILTALPVNRKINIKMC